jgi:hypothetical protein
VVSGVSSLKSCPEAMTLWTQRDHCGAASEAFDREPEASSVSSAEPVISPARWAGPASDKVPFEEPCPERRGLVERRGAVFLHFCV